MWRVLRPCVPSCSAVAAVARLPLPPPRRRPPRAGTKPGGAKLATPLSFLFRRRCRRRRWFEGVLL
eukprot:582553-Lingulodinium_polyedra.AAC.1